MAGYLRFNKLIVVWADLIAVTSSLFFAYLLRFELNISSSQFYQLVQIIPVVVIIKMSTYYLFKMYRGMWRYTSLRDLTHLSYANLFAQFCVVFYLLLLYRFEGYSRSIFIIDFLICSLFTAGIRVAIRIAYMKQMTGNTESVGKLLKIFGSGRGRKRNVLIIGAGNLGEALTREIMCSCSDYHIVGFLDDDPRKVGLTIHGVPVLGKVEKFREISQGIRIDEILIGINRAPNELVKKLVAECEKRQISVKVMPSMTELIEGRVSLKELKDFSYEDLLNRPPVRLDDEGIRDYIHDKTILITGAGGSIGSEICRQLLKFDPKRLILFDANEYLLFSVQAELSQKYHFNDYVSILGRVQDSLVLERIFNSYKPHVVFHAAAYKHVPFVEMNPWEGIFNNVVGSKNVMEAALKHHTNRFVLVSSDKAVRPCNVMGACKRISEMVMQSLSGNGTKMMAVRFGNVLGSSGSVIPFFRQQIKKGGPVTVTHPEMTRFFMSIPEAAKLVLQAGAMGGGGEVFVLKMGTPVKIAKMAEDLIKLSGKEPYKDINIVFTGTRPGEKLYEELITSGENIIPTGHEKIMMLSNSENWAGFESKELMRDWIYSEMDELRRIACTFNEHDVKGKIKDIVAEYTPKQTGTVFDSYMPDGDHIITKNTEDTDFTTINKQQILLKPSF